MGRRQSASAAPALPRRARRAPVDLCRWHEDSPNGWIVLFAIISQMSTMAGSALWHCIPNAPKAVVQPLLSGFFLHLRVVRSASTGELRVLFTDIMRSFGMGNTGWKVHLANRFPDARKIRVTDGVTGGHNEYISLSLGDFGQFVRWAHGERTGVNPARDASIRTTFQKDEPQPKAARAFLQQAYDLLAAFGKLPSADSPSLTTFLLGREFIREATFAAGGLREVNADGSMGTPLALAAFQLDQQTKAPAEKEQRRIDKENKMQLNKQRKAQGLPPLRTRQPKVTKPKVKAVQIGPQIGKKKGRGKQRERAPPAVEAEEDDDDDEVVVMGEDEGNDGEESENEGEEVEENEDDEDKYLPPLPPQSPLRDDQQPPLRDSQQAVEECGPAVCRSLFDLPSPVPAGAFEFHEPALAHYSWPDSDLFDLSFDGDAVGSLLPSAPHGDAFAIAARD